MPSSRFKIMLSLKCHHQNQVREREREREDDMLCGRIWMKICKPGLDGAGNGRWRGAERCRGHWPTRWANNRSASNAPPLLLLCTTHCYSSSHSHSHSPSQFLLLLPPFCLIFLLLLPPFCLIFFFLSVWSFFFFFLCHLAPHIWRFPTLCVCSHKTTPFYFYTIFIYPHSIPFHYILLKKWSMS